MIDHLLQTKLHRPPLRPSLVSRPRLYEQLDQSLQPGHKLTLVSAPAGFGKTTLISEWAQSATEAAPRRAIAWLTLDENDNDPARFLAYCVAALNGVKGLEIVGRAMPSMLQSPQLPPIEELLVALINDIATIPDSIILVLDDYHMIDSSPVDDALAFLLENLPPQMQLVIATREDPNLPLARLRGRGHLTELRAAQLRFTFDEAAEFLNQVMGLDLSAEDVSSLEKRTEGWIAGLQLAAISMQGRDDASSLITSFTGSHRFVLDYLVEEVLERQPENIQSFLLQTSILNRLSGPLCDALTEQVDGWTTLQTLEQANLFIISLDEERCWYRYHSLLSDLLRRRLRQAQPKTVRTLHRRASKWYAENGLADEAIDHALQAKEIDQAARLILDRSDAYWGQGEHKKLRRWLDGLPEETILASPHLSMFQARYQYNNGQLDAAERTLRAAEQVLNDGTGSALGVEPPNKSSFTESEQVKLLGRAAATRALMCSYQGDVPGIIQQATRALELLPGEDLTWRSVTALTLGNAHGFKGDMKAAYRARFEAAKACQEAGDIYFVTMANLEVAITLREQGQLRRTVETCRQQLQFANENGLMRTRTVGWLLAIWGETLAELNDLDGAAQRAKKGFEITESSDDLQLLGWSFMCLVRVLFSKGDLVEAEEIIRKMENIARESRLPPWITGQISAWQVRLWLTQNEVEAASDWAKERGLETSGQLKPASEISFFLLLDYLILARILLARSQLDQASRLLQRLFEAAEAGDRTSRVIEILILQALTYQALGAPERAVVKLKQALALAEPEGFVRVFVDEGRPMFHLLHEAYNRGIAPAYSSRLLAAFPTDDPLPAGEGTRQVDHSELFEPLSERELEVLQSVAKGHTNQEIADQLFLSPHTIKVHTRNIYGKLDVHNRTQAVARARALGILPPV